MQRSYVGPLTCPVRAYKCLSIRKFGIANLDMSVRYDQRRKRGEVNGKVKGKINRITVHEGPKIRLDSFSDLGARWGVGGQIGAPPQPIYPRGKTFCTHFIGDWVDPRAQFGWAQKMPPPLAFYPRTVYPVASPYTNWVIVMKAERIWINQREKKRPSISVGLPVVLHNVWWAIISRVMRSAKGRKFLE
jgi:hypothetical protein